MNLTTFKYCGASTFSRASSPVMSSPSTDPPSLGRIAGKTRSFIRKRWYPERLAFLVDGTLSSRANRTCSVQTFLVRFTSGQSTRYSSSGVSAEELTAFCQYAASGRTLFEATITANKWQVNPLVSRQNSLATVRPMRPGGACRLHGSVSAMNIVRACRHEYSQNYLPKILTWVGSK